MSMHRAHRRKDGIYEARLRVRPTDPITYRSTGSRDKSVAQSITDEWFRQMEREAYGVASVTTKEKTAAEKPLSVHLRDYLNERSLLGLNDRYTTQIEGKLNRLFDECGWQYIRHVDKNSFNTWRTTQSSKLSPHTLNEYLGAISGLLKWMIRNDYITANPLDGAGCISKKKWEKDSPRALSQKEVAALLSACGPRRTVYMTAVLTGIRHGELKQLRVSDLDLDSETPGIKVRSTISKNGKERWLPVCGELLELLREVKASRSAGQNVFVMPKWKTLHLDLKRAGIPWRNEENRKVSFHSFRHTFCTAHLAAGTAPRVVQALMGHSDIKLTTGNYTDTAQLPLAASVNQLPSYEDAKSSPHIAPLEAGSNGHFLSQTDKVGFLDTLSKVLGVMEFRLGLAELVNDLGWSGKQDSNLRLLGPKPSALPD